MLSTEVSLPPQRLAYGWLSFRPDCLQRANNARCLVVCLCLAAAVQAMAQMGFVNVCLTTIEKRFHLKSAVTGQIVGVFDVAFVLVCLPVSYLASRPGASKPRWLGGGMLLMALGSLVYASPHFLAGPYSPNSSAGDAASLCVTDGHHSACAPSTQSSLENYRHVFMLGQILHGIGSTPIYILGTVFIDESVPKELSSWYIGIFSAMFVGGAAVGFIVGSSMLQVYVDWPYVSPAIHDLTPSSDLWLGCWWLCFLVSGCAAAVVAVPLLAFPLRIPISRHGQHVPHVYSPLHDQDDLADSEESLNENSFMGEISKVCRNVTFMLLTFADFSTAFTATALGAFMPKMVENEFSLPASTAALIVGISGVFSGVAGSVVAGWLLKRCSVDCWGALRACTWGAVLMFITCFAFFIHCPNSDMAGVFVPYEYTSPPAQLPSLVSPCNLNCNCSGVLYNPVCGANNVIYYSPCHAGCSSRHQFGDKEVYQNCSCVTLLPLPPFDDSVATSWGTPVSLPTPLMEGTARPDRCASSCGLLVPFIMLFAFAIFTQFALAMSSVSAALRCIEEREKSMAFGLRAQLTRLLGSMPGPIVFGAFLDQTCAVWQETCGGDRGSCAVYDLKTMTRSMLYLSLVVRVLAVPLYAFAWRSHRPLKEGDSITDLTLKDLSTPSDDSLHEGVRHRKD